MDATQFWTSIKPSLGPEQLPPVDGIHSESASVKESDENVINRHHYELGDTYALPFHWDRYLFRLVCYMETSLIHESVKQKTFDMKMIETLRDVIRSGARDYMLFLGDRSISEIPESIIPTAKSYRDATSPTPKRKPTAKIKVEQSGNADARQLFEMEVEHSGDADESQASTLDDMQGENADADASEVKADENEKKRIEEIMSFVTDIYQPDASKLIMKGNQQFVLTPWATDRDSAKCTFCEGMCQTDRSGSSEAKPVCLRCGGVLLIAEEVATATSEVPWSTDELDLVKAVMVANYENHNLENEKKSVKSETKESEKKKKPEPFINQVFGHDQSAIEGFKDCEDQLQKNLDLERAERDPLPNLRERSRPKRSAMLERAMAMTGTGLKRITTSIAEGLLTRVRINSADPNLKKWALNFLNGPIGSFRRPKPPSR